MKLLENQLKIKIKSTRNKRLKGIDQITQDELSYTNKFTLHVMCSIFLILTNQYFSKAWSP